MFHTRSQLIRNVRSRRHIDSSIIAHLVNFDIQRKRSLKCDTIRTRHTHTHIYDPLDNRYGFSISVQPEIDCTTFQFLFMKCFEKILVFKFFKSWLVCDWLAKWLIMLGFRDLRWLRVFGLLLVVLFKLDLAYLVELEDLTHL